MIKRGRLIRLFVLFVVVPLFFSGFGLQGVRVVRSWLASRTPGLTLETAEFEGRSVRYAVIEPLPGRFEGPRPLLVFLHSAAECGTDGYLPAAKISPTLLTHCREKVGAIVLLPQMATRNQGWNSAWNQDVFGLIQQVQHDQKIDSSRIYLLGMSLGGQGCWSLAAERPDLFAAAVPICGNGPVSLVAPRLQGVPIWAFHGSEDRRIPVQGSRKLVTAIQSAGGQRIRYTEYKGVGHNCWNTVMGDPELLDWLFRQTLNQGLGRKVTVKE